MFTFENFTYHNRLLLLFTRTTGDMFVAFGCCFACVLDTPKN